MASNSKEQQRKADAKRAGKRFRNWACLAYPESAVAGWKDKLSEKCVPCFISPLHDMDTWSATDEEENPEHKEGTPKKAHHHIMFMFSAVKTKEQVEEITESLGFTMPINVRDAAAYARYLCHLGENGKHVYSPDDVIQFGGIDYLDMIQSSSNVVQAIAEMEDWCEENGVTSYSQLSRYCRRERPDLYRVLIHNGRHIEKFLKAAEWELRKAGREEENRLMAEYCALKRMEREAQESQESKKTNKQEIKPESVAKAEESNSEDWSWLEDL